MPHFRDSHPNIRIKHSIDGAPGLRKSQIGAVHALSAHFSLREDPGLVVLPTGTGKTAVLMLAPYLLLSDRVLIITQSRFVRDQIARDYMKLDTLKRVEAVTADQEPPRIFVNRERVGTPEAWEAFRDYDVVVATPSSASPAIKGVARPPADLFDLVLVDEAHHSPAASWNALIEAFPNARVILLTATPFRRDRKEIKAKYLYAYPIQRAFEDGTYGEMSYLPIDSIGQNTDEAIALATEKAFNEDLSGGFKHSVMVRADSVPRAKELADIYKRITALRLELVESSQSQRSAEKTVQRLRDGELDGVICVNMLGEGFDLPRLKIAALHAPHRSLGVTLQFFGRFARINGTNLGDARFIAARHELAGEMAELFAESDSWGKKIRLLGEKRIGEEVEARQFLESFEEEAYVESDRPIDDISLYSFSLFNHVKVHDVHGTVSLARTVAVPGFKTEKHWISDDQSTAVTLLREAVRPKWATTPGLDRVEYHLVVTHWDEKARLLFVCSTYREESLYKTVGKSLVDGSFRTLSLNRTNRVLRSFSELELFNLGIRNRATGTVAESYRQMSGPSAHQALQKADAALYHRGHIFGKGSTARGYDTIGVSSLGKIWRLNYSKIPELVSWCRRLARDIENPAPFKTGISIDAFDAGTDISVFPKTPFLAADWDEQVYSNPVKITFADGSGADHSVSLLDLELSPGAEPTDDLHIPLVLEHDEFRSKLTYAVGPVPSLQYADANQPRISVVRGFNKIDLLNYISEEQIRFFLGDGSVLQGAELFAPIEEGQLTFEAERLRVIDWNAESVEIQREFGDCAPSLSIHDWLKKRLVTEHEIVFYDHRSGECADFLGADAAADGKPKIVLYHCKGSKGDKAGNRPGDLYEVCGQAIKSTKFRNRRVLLKHVKRRVAGGSQFLKGTHADFVAMIDPDPRFEIPLSVVVVQPGLSQRAMDAKTSGLLVTVNRGLIAVACNPLGVMCSS